MPKGYWIAHVAANNADSFGSDSYAQYIAGARPAFEEFGASFLARGGETVIAEGSDIGTRHVVIEFESLELAKACYRSPAYQKAMKHRQAVSSATILLTEGV